MKCLILDSGQLKYEFREWLTEEFQNLRTQVELDTLRLRLLELAREPSEDVDCGAVGADHQRRAASPTDLVTGRQFLPSCGVLIRLLL